MRDGGELAEALTVNIHLNNITISCTTAYWPQEYAPLTRKTEFWGYLEEEVERASKEGNGFLLQGDLNAWICHDLINGDRRQNQNGKMLATFVETNNLTIVNTLPICRGPTTWSKVRKGTQLSST